MTNLLDAGLKRRTVLGSIVAGAAAAGGTAQGRTLQSTNGTADDRLGAPLPRADGPQKVSGRATYAIEHRVANLAYGVLVQSTIPAGHITDIDAEAASAAPGVLRVYTHRNAPRIAPATMNTKGGAATESFLPLQDDQVRWNGQHIAFVVAETFEQATEAASLVRVTYRETQAVLDPASSEAARIPQENLNIEWGNARDVLAQAEVQVEGIYTTPREYNVPIEPHACIASWEGEHLTVWEPSQWVGGARGVIAEWMATSVDNVRVVSPFIGGGFGSKVAPHPHVAITCAVARELGRPVKTSLTRPQTFTGLGGRARTHQQLQLGATMDGKLLSIVHESWNETAIDDHFVEPCNAVTPYMYASPNFHSRHSVAPVHTVTPGWLRAPGENPSTFALECAMDELAYKVGIDPLELRLRNYAAFDPKAKVPWTTRQLREAYRAGAEAFGWSRRSFKPRSMREGRALIGWGMASGTYPVRRTPGEARLIVRADGTAEVHSSGSDLGTGTYTILAQTVAEVLGVPAMQVKVLLGDTSLPMAPLAGGSHLANVLVGAVQKAAIKTREALLDLAANHPQSPFAGQGFNELSFVDGRIRPVRRPAGGVRIADLLAAIGQPALEVQADTFAPGSTAEDRRLAGASFRKMRLPTDGGVSAHSWSAQFVEVRVDEDFGTVRVKRMVGAFDSGRIFNPRLARSQWMGGMIMGLGQALLEDGASDPGTGRVVNASLADYLVAVNADVPAITTLSVGVPDLTATAAGGKAVGELGIVGVAAAISNAVFHATGKRIRDLPITLEKVIV